MQRRQFVETLDLKQQWLGCEQFDLLAKLNSKPEKMVTMDLDSICTCPGNRAVMHASVESFETDQNRIVVSADCFLLTNLYEKKIMCTPNIKPFNWTFVIRRSSFVTRTMVTDQYSQLRSQLPSILSSMGWCPNTDVGTNSEDSNSLKMLLTVSDVKSKPISGKLADTSSE